MKRLHSFSALFALALGLLLIPSAADAQQQGTVYFNDGRVLSGQVLEYVPGDHITLQIGNTQPIVIQNADIARVELGPPPSPIQPFAPEPTQPPLYQTQPYQPPPQQQAYQPVQPYQPAQPYQLQQPYSQPPPRRKPGLGLPITFLSIGAVLALSGGALISLSNDTYYTGTDESLLYPGIAFATAGGVFFTLGVVFLFIRIGQRRRWTQEQQGQPVQPQYGFAPIISPEQSLYGLAGMMTF